MKTFFAFIVGVVLAGGLCYLAFYKTPQERAFVNALKQAKAGHEEAMLAVAQDYIHGTGTPANIEQALSWYQKAAARGNSQAAFELARLYSEGKWVPAEPETALAYLQSAAQANYATAQYQLGQWYEQGNHVPRHEGQALFWYLQAFQNGSSAAQTALAPFSQTPLYEEVARFYDTLQKASQTNSQAQLEVAQAYRYGNPILQDNEAAFKWFKKAWESSQETLSQAAYELSLQYAQGIGVDKDEAQATEFLARAAELQNPAAQYQLGSMSYSEEPPRLEDAFAWFSNAATQGHAQAQYMTGFMLLQGQGTQKSVPLALRFFEQAAQQNDASAQYVLGQIYLKGLGVRKDEKTGRNWLERAAENGNTSAQTLLGK